MGYADHPLKSGRPGEDLPKIRNKWPTGEIKINVMSEKDRKKAEEEKKKFSKKLDHGTDEPVELNSYEAPEVEHIRNFTTKPKMKSLIRRKIKK